MDTLDEVYVLDAQDPNEPVWETDANIAEMSQVDDVNDEYDNGAVPAIRASNGVLDFLTDINEEVSNFLEDDRPVPPAKQKLDAIRTRELGADHWRPGRREVAASMTAPIVTASPYRRSVTLVNYGPDVVYVSNIAGAIAGAPNTNRLLVSGAAFYAPMTLATRDDIWAVSATVAGALVEVTELFDQDC